MSDDLKVNAALERATECALAEAAGWALRWTHDKPTKPGVYLIAAAPNTTPSLVSVRQATDGTLVLVDEPDGCDSLDQLDDLHDCHLWYGPVPVPNAKLREGERQ